MKYRQMGRWGVRLSAVGLGSYLTIGFKNDDQTSRDTVRVAYEAGVNFFDTANAYNRGEGERALGRCLREFPRASVVILSKVWAPMGPGPNDRGLSAKHVFEQCHASLKRLDTDYLDIYMCHRPDPGAPLEETIRAMEDLARQGKVLYWGVSEWPAPLVVRAQAVAREMLARPIAVSEPRYNLLYRYPERDLFPTTASEGIGNVIFSPLAHGLLTGKYPPGQPAPEGTRAADPEQNAVMMGMYWTEENKRKGQELTRIARDLGVTAAQLSIAWCLRRPEVTSVILGARSVSQLQDNLKAVEVEITGEVEGKLEALYPPVEKAPTA